jgi:hypothetical protein
MTPVYYAGYRIEMRFFGHYTCSVWRPEFHEPWIVCDVVEGVSEDYEAALRAICARIDADRAQGRDDLIRQAGPSHKCVP